MKRQIYRINKLIYRKEIHFESNSIGWLEMKGWEWCTTQIVIKRKLDWLYYYKTDCRTKKVTRDRVGNYIRVDPPKRHRNLKYIYCK